MHNAVVADVTILVNVVRTDMAVVIADVRRAKAKNFLGIIIPAGIPICIAIIIRTSARIYKICIMISIVESRRAPVGTSYRPIDVLGVTIRLHSMRTVYVNVVEERRAKAEFLLVV